MKLHYLQHVPFEGLGSIETWARRNGWEIGHTALYADAPLPAVDAFDFLVVMGGPMNIYEHEAYPWLVREKEFIAQVVAAGTPVLGVCLGAQLIADVLGGRVFSGKEKEIGWFPITLTDAAMDAGWGEVFGRELTVMHWHGDTFPIPEGALHLAASAACPNQGFVYEGRVMGLQFHVETTRDSLTALIDNCRDELIDAPYIQTPEEMLEPGRPFAAINGVMDRVLDRLTGQTTP